MVQLAFKVQLLAITLLSLSTLSLAKTRTCTTKQLNGSVGPSSGGRKIGIVIDESSSMQDNDPTNIRIVAGKALDESLITASESKTNGKKADLVTVAGFHSTSDLLYPLGDPAGALSIIDAISSAKSGTFIGSGIKEATDELTKAGTGATANRTGIVVLTDGEDNFSGLTGVQGTINSINRAGKLGIRVSFGFLSVTSSAQDPLILSAILNTGGAFTSFTSAISQQSFISQVLLQGLTGIDGSSNTTTLFPGLTTSAALEKTGENSFTYSAEADETFNFTITAVDTISLKATLKDVKTNKELTSKTTNTTGIAFIEYTAKSKTDLELVVEGTTKDTKGIFSVGLQSELGPCQGNGTIPSNTTIPSNATTTRPPVQYTGGASSAGEFKAIGAAISFFGILFAFFLV